MAALTFSDVEAVLGSNSGDTAWVQQEFENVDLSDTRLNRRLIPTAESLAKSPLSSINEACDDWAQTQGASPSPAICLPRHPAPEAIQLVIDTPTYYAFRLQPGDLGTKGGLATDERSRVLRGDGTVIRGLYAAGNSSSPVMGRSYAGNGSTLGPAMTFGYIAANDIDDSPYHLPNKL